MKYKYIIIESNESVVEELYRSFTKFPDYICVGNSGCYNKALDLILEHNPDLVFIDVDNTSGLNAFNFVNDLYKYVHELPRFIALSQSTAHAYNSIKNNFFDYLLKPVNQFELRKTISMFSKINKEQSSKLCLKSYKDYRFIDIEEILFLKADNNSTDFFMADDSVISAYKTLKSFEAILPENFTRIHNSYIVNKNYISRIHFGKSKCTIKKSSYDIPFSKSYKNNVVVLEKSLSKEALLSLN